MVASLKSNKKIGAASVFSWLTAWCDGVMDPRWSSRNFDSIWLSFTSWILSRAKFCKSEEINCKKNCQEGQFAKKKGVLNDQMQNVQTNDPQRGSLPAE